MLKNGLSLGEMINATRRNGQDGGRPYSFEPGDRSAGSDPPPSAKDKSFLSFLRKRKPREDGTFPSPDEAGSPTSPASSFRHFLGNRAGNASETSLDRPGTGFTSDAGGAPTRPRRSNSPRVYILATVDYWNYRMVDVTDIDTPAEFREILCVNLGISNFDSAQVFLTELGKADHDDPLDNFRLMASKRSKADAVGTLKLFVRPIEAQQLQQQQQQQQQSHVMGTPTTRREISPSSYLTPGAQMDQDAYAKLNGQRQRSSSSPPTSRQNTMSSMTEVANSTLTREAQAYREEQLRKQHEYLAKRKQATMKEPSSAETPLGIVGRNVDFDQPRVSPFEDRRPDNLFPQRKAPAPPGDPSATLIKANSLSKKTGQAARTSPDGSESPGKGRSSKDLREEMYEKQRRKQASQPSGGIGGLLVGMGNRLGGVGHPITSGKRRLSPRRDTSSTTPDTGTNDAGKHTQFPTSLMLQILLATHHL